MVLLHKCVKCTLILSLLTVRTICAPNLTYSLQRVCIFFKSYSNSSVKRLTVWMVHQTLLAVNKQLHWSRLFSKYCSYCVKIPKIKSVFKSFLLSLSLSLTSLSSNFPHKSSNSINCTLKLTCNPSTVWTVVQSFWQSLSCTDCALTPIYSPEPVQTVH